MNSGIHVCHLSSVHFALDTRIFYRFCHSLSKKYKVTLIAVHPRDERMDGIDIVAFTRYKNKLLRVLITWAIMFVKAMQQKAVIYQIHDPELILTGILLKCMGKKVIYDIHENIAEDIFDKPWIQYKKTLYFFYDFFEKIAIRLFYIILAEHSYENRYKKRNAQYSTVLNYPDHAFFTEYYIENRPKTNRIFYIGIILESRGILEIAEALWLLKQKEITVYFDIVGEIYTDLAEKLHALSFYTEIKDQLIFHGRKSLDEGYNISRDAAIGMCIIHPMSNSIHSYPTKMFEYMCIGLPQVISHFPLYASVVETHNCGLLVDPKSPLQIADAIATLMHSDALRKEFGSNAKKASVHFNWKTEEEKVWGIYNAMTLNNLVQLP